MLLEIFDPKAPPRPIGIDLGTTNSIVARMRDGSPMVIRDCDGEWLVPSAVHVDDRDHVIVGRHALTLASAAPARTVVSVKRLMGRGANDEETRRLSTFDFVPAATAEEAKSVRFRVGQRVMTPVEASAEILKSLLQMAKDELGPVGGAVITVPAYFDDAQRQATKDAAKLAGLPVLRLLNEPTAAALAYGLEQRKNGLFAVFDLGGGTFDITILSLDDGVFEVKSTGGNTELGGDDMDRALAEKILESGGDVTRSPRRVRAALDAARQIKHALTDNETVEIEASDVGLPAFRITRAEFDALVRPIVEKTGATCKRAMRDAGVTPKDLDGVILVGGSTRVPLVRRYVAEVFGKEPLSDLNPEEVVALGAAIQAHQLAGEGDKEDILLLDVLPLSLGMETMGGVAEKILPRNTPIPASARQVFTTYADNQTGFDIAVVQGERELAADCRSLARFTLKGIPPMAAGLARLEVTFAVDADGLLQVHAKELTTGVEQTIQVKPSYGLTDEEVEAMLLAAIDHGEKDLLDRRLVEERVEAERVVHATEKALMTDATLLEPGEREAIDDAIRQVRAAIEGGKPALIHARVEHLDEATKAWAGRRMDRASAAAIAGRRVGDVESTVSAAKGVDEHLREHGSGRNG